jgi:hypothetical protein
MSRNVHLIGAFNSGNNLVYNIINKSQCINLTDNTSIYITDQHKPIGKHTIDISAIENHLYEPSI